MKKKYAILLISIIIILISNVVSPSFPEIFQKRVITTVSGARSVQIMNSRGHAWNATSSNIQKAINDLQNSTGTVYLPGNKTFYLTQTIIVWKNIMLDMDGAEFRLPTGVNTNVVELKDGAGIQDGSIDVAGHQAPEYKSNTSFMVPYAAIYLNASSYITSAFIGYMTLESISDGYNMTPIAPYYVTINESGRGYGIYLHATNTSASQKISFVSVDHVSFRSFKIAIYLNNERNTTSGNRAYLNNNIFTDLSFHACSWGINMTRASSNNYCTISCNSFDMLLFQTGDGSYWGGESITHGVIRIDGEGNYIKNLIVWDFSANHVGDGSHAVYFTPLSSYNFVRIPALNDAFYNDSGTNNTFIDFGAFYSNNNTLLISKVVEKYSLYGKKYEYYTTVNANIGLYGGIWLAQTFTIGTTGRNVTHYLQNISVYIGRDGETGLGTCYAFVRAVDGAGQPTGANLSIGSFDGDAISNVTYETKYIQMSNMTLTKGTKYALILSAPSGDIDHVLNWAVDVAGTYAGGNAFQTWDSGGSYASYGPYDLYFCEYGS